MIDPTDATLWFANNEMKPENKLSVHLGKNEKTKVIVKVSTRRVGQPVSESWLDEENQKKIALMNHRKVLSRQQCAVSFGQIIGAFSATGEWRS